MSDDKMQDKSDYYLVIGPIEKNCGGYTAEDRKEWLEESWCGVSIEWIGTDKSIDYQRGYEAGRQAERDRIRAMLKQAILGPMFDIARKVEDATDGRWDLLKRLKRKAINERESTQRTTVQNRQFRPAVFGASVQLASVAA